MSNPAEHIRADSASPKSGNGHARIRHMEVLLDVSRRLAVQETLDEMLVTLIGIATSETGADRSSLFLHDERTKELYSKVAEGDIYREIRVADTVGVVGHVFTHGKPLLIHDTGKNSYFDSSTDGQTGYKTKSILCAPVKTIKGRVIGVIQSLNRKKGRFTKSDLSMLEAIGVQSAFFLEGIQRVEKMKSSSEEERSFLDVVSEVTAEIDLHTLIQKVMLEAARMLHAERTTLFLNDEKTAQLWSEVGVGLGASQIRFPNHLGIAGAVFTSGETINIPHAYADLRFNPAFDRQTGFFTRSILCVPVVNKNGKRIGVTQALNKRGEPFSEGDEARLKAFTGQVAIALENAQLFSEVQNMKNYNESVLESMTNGVITMDDAARIVTCNTSGTRILKLSGDSVIGKKAEEFFSGDMSWIAEKINRVLTTYSQEILIDVELALGASTLSVNLTILPLKSSDGKIIGVMMMIDDITSEKRMKSTMSRYMDPTVADQMLGEGAEFLEGKKSEATVLFSDIRGFTTLTEELGPQGTVSLLNEYFTIMVDCIQRENGMLDKFIGDAIMAGFGVPLPSDDDADRAIRTAISMITCLNEWNKKRASEGKDVLKIGIGLNTDEVVVGNIGSPKRMDYTMIGDGVNLAARLEAACKHYGTSILMSERSLKRLRGTYRLREIDKVVVKGKTESVVIYEIMDHHTPETYPDMMEALQCFREGLDWYRSRKWDNAIKAFNAVLAINPKDVPATLYVDRCNKLKETPPPDDWDGIWIMAEK